MDEEAKMLDVSKVLSLIEKIKKNADELKTVSESYGGSRPVTAIITVVGYMFM